MNLFQAILRLILSLFGGRPAAQPPVGPSGTLGPGDCPPGTAATDHVAWAARELDADLAAVRAVLEVESGGRASLPSGRAVVRFEGATFSKATGGAFDRTHPTLSMKGWRKNNAHVRGGEAEWERLEEAAELDRDAAYESASYGAAQIMGFNYRVAGYPDVHAFVEDMNAGEAGQIRAFVRFVQGRGLAEALRQKDWRRFARGYNGTGQVDDYATALARAYARHEAAIGPAEPPGPTENPDPAPRPSSLFPPTRRWEDYRDIPIEAWRARWPNFTPAEIGGKAQDPHDRTIIVVPAALDALQALRREWGRPIVITSGYRSPAYNRRVGGVAQSKHLQGIAFDCLMLPDQQDAFKAMAVRHGFGGIGTYDTFIHIDTRPERKRWDRRTNTKERSHD